MHSTDASFKTLAPWNRRFLSAVLGILLIGLAGCSRDKDAVEPKPLPDFTQEVTLDEVWSRGVGDGQGGAWLHLEPAVDGDRIYTVSASGRVTALNRLSGKVLWSTELERRVGGGVGVGEGLVLIGTRDGHVVALDANDEGRKLWESALTTEVLSAPQISNGVVVVQTIDSRIFGLNAGKNGERLWQQDTLQPVLTLRGTSKPTIENGVVYAGFANGEARAFRLTTGTLLWDARVAVARGTSELERMVDVDSAPLLANDVLYMVSYQGNVVGLEPSSGHTLWSRESSSYENMGQGFGNLYLSTADSLLSAVDQRTGAVVWSQKKLEHRGLSGPAAMGSYVLAGDFAGYLHVLSQVDGRIVGRTKVNSSGIRTRPLVVDDMIYVYTNDGSLAALSVK